MQTTIRNSISTAVIILFVLFHARKLCLTKGKLSLSVWMKVIRNTEYTYITFYNGEPKICTSLSLFKANGGTRGRGWRRAMSARGERNSGW